MKSYPEGEKKNVIDILISEKNLKTSVPKELLGLTSTF